MTEWTLITGGAQNLGREIARHLAGKGHAVLVHYQLSDKEAFDLVEECRFFGVDAEAIEGDFSTEGSLADFSQRCNERFPSIRHLVNNVGTFSSKPLLETSLADLQSLLQTNLLSPLYFAQSLNPKESIINIGMAGVEQLKAYPYAAGYQIAKTALLQVTKTLAVELAERGVRVNMVSPGMLERSEDSLDEKRLIPFKRRGSFLEVARVVSFLLEEESNYITGQNIVVAGGLRLK